MAAILSAAPAACVALWDAVARGDHACALDLHGRLLALWNAIAGDNLPACVKYAQSLQQCPAGLPRAPMPPAPVGCAAQHLHGRLIERHRRNLAACSEPAAACRAHP